MKRCLLRLPVLCPALLATLCAQLLCAQAQAGAYIVADESNLDIRSHARNFNGLGGELEPIRVCLDVQENAALAIQAEPAVKNVITTFNRFRSLARNTYASGADADVPANAYDLESTLLHEMLHAHGLAHPHHADEAGLTGDAYYGTKSADGPNNVWNQGAGTDGVHGSADDVRGDDINLHWYQRGVNDPGALPGVVDESTMARTLAALPAGQLFAANANRQVLAGLGYANAEAAAVQGARPGEAQRHLQHDDIATLRLARAGVDGIQGTPDDYRSTLVYVGRMNNPQGETCQIAVRFDTSTAFASSSIGSYRIAPNHWGIMSARIRFNATVNWYMTPGPNTVTSIVSDLPDASSGTQLVTVRVNLAKAAGNPIATNPLGVIEVRDGPRDDPATAYCSIVLAGTANETGECQLSPNLGGHRTLTAEYLGYGGFDASSDTEQHTITGSVAFSAIGSSSDPVAVGAPLTLQWTLGPPFGAQPLAFGGTVVVKDAPDCASPPSDPAHQCSVALPGSRCSITFGTAGPRTLQLCYAGDGAVSPASASFAQEVISGRATGVGIVEVTPANAAPFEPVTVKVRVDESPAQGGQPRGVVEVLDGPPNDLFTSRCSVALAGTPGEVGQCTLVPVDAGPHTLSANFAVQGPWLASSASTPLDVTQLRIVRALPAVARIGQGISITVDFGMTKFLDPPPGGYIDVSNGSEFCRVYPPGSECTWTTSTPGLHNLVATWTGDGSHPPRSSAPFAVQVVDPRMTVVSAGARAYPDSNGVSESNKNSLSANGRWLLFKSLATNLVPDDSNGIADLFVRDARTGILRRVNTSSSGAQANGESGDYALSANGRYVVFSSLASNLVPDDTNNVRDVFLKDLITGSTVRVSMNSDGSQPTADNEFEGMPTSISADGRYVAFLTFARLLPRDTNIHNDVYVKDMLTGELDLVSTAADESLANFRNHMPSISATGRYVVFASQASNFVPEDTDIGTDVYIKDRVTRQIRLASANAAGQRPNDASMNPSVSADGRYVTFLSYSRDLALPVNNANPDVYIKDLQTGAVERAQANASGSIVGGVTNAPAMTPDGRYVAFQLNYFDASTGAMTRLYLKDRSTGELVRIDRTSSGLLQTTGAAITPAISADGRFVSFASNNTNVTLFDTNGLQDVFVFDRTAFTSQRAAVTGGVRANGDSGEAMISRDGSRVIFTSDATNITDNDANLVRDAFLFNNGSTAFALRATNSLVQRADSPTLSGDNAWVGFRTVTTNIVTGDTNNKPDVYIGNQDSFVFYRASTDSSGAQVTAGTVLGPVSLNQNASLIVFRASDTTLVAGDSNGYEDVFLKNRSSNATSMVSTTAGGVPGNGDSSQSMISDDGSRVAFTSLATNFAADDSNGVSDIYVKILADGSIVRASSAADGTPGNAASSAPSLSSDGRYVAFLSAASNLVPGDDNGRIDVFVKDLSTGAITRANVGSAGQQGTGGDCVSAAISGDASWAGFVCAQAGLIDGVAASTALAYVKNRQSGYLHLVSVDATGAPANLPVTAGPRAIANDGRMVFATAANNLVPGDTQNFVDIFRTLVPAVPLLATSTRIDSHAPDPSLPGQAYTVAVSVTRSSGSAAVGGSVSVSDGSAVCSATLSGSGATASGSCALASAAPGTKQLTASYGGSATYAASVATPVSHAVLTPAAPSAPFIGAVTRGNGQVAVGFLPPADPGTSAVDGYTAECGSQSATGTVSPISVGGLANGTPVSCRVRAYNSVGPGPWSAQSAHVTPAGLPGAPGNAVATRGNAQASVAFSAPGSNGGAPLLGYIARCGSASQAGPASPIVVGGLSNGVAVSCTVAAVNEVGEGAASAPSNSVTPATVPGAPAPPGVVRGNGRVTVSFSAPANGGTIITGYVARCGNASSSGSASPLEVAGLANGTPVTCTVAAVNAIGEGAQSPPSASVTPATVPNAPGAVVATRGNAQVSLAFTAPADGGSAVTGYSASCGSASQSGPASPLVVTGLVNGTPVSCTVKASNEVGESASSAPSNTVTPATLPGAPTAVVATRGNAQVSVAFTAPLDNGGSAVSGYVARCGSGSQNGTASPLLVSGLSNGVAVTCTVAAVNEIGEGAASAPSSSVTPATVPAAPTAVVATRGNGQVSVAFGLPASDGGSAVTGYTARCGSGSQSGTASPLVVTGLANGTAVTCTVTATNEIGEGAASTPSASVTPAAVPDAPTGVQATRGNAQVSVAFTPPGSNGGSEVTGYTARCGSASQDGTISPLTVVGLSNGVAVTCTVTARNKVGEGPASAPSASVTPATVPAAPVLGSAVATPNGSGITLGFGTPDNGGNAITGYEARCTPGTQTASGPASPLTVTGLSAGTAYTCTVSARNELGLGAASNGLAATPRIQADVAISVGNGVNFVRGGTRPGWLVEVDNSSAYTVTGARVQTSLPAHLTDPTWVCSATGGAACPAASGSGTLDVLVNLAAGSRVSFLLNANVPTTPEQPLQVSATVSLPGAYLDPQTGNNSASDTDPVGIFRDGFQ